MNQSSSQWSFIKLTLWPNQIDLGRLQHSNHSKVLRLPIPRLLIDFRFTVLRAALLRQEVVGVATATAVAKRLAPPRSRVVMPALEDCSTRSNFRWQRTSCWNRIHKRISRTICNSIIMLYSTWMTPIYRFLGNILVFNVEWQIELFPTQNSLAPIRGRSRMTWNRAICASNWRFVWSNNYLSA